MKSDFSFYDKETKETVNFASKFKSILKADSLPLFVNFAKQARTKFCKKYDTLCFAEKFHVKEKEASLIRFAVVFAAPAIVEFFVDLKLTCDHMLEIPSDILCDIPNQSVDHLQDPGERVNQVLKWIKIVHSLRVFPVKIPPFYCEIMTYAFVGNFIDHQDEKQQLLYDIFAKHPWIIKEKHKYRERNLFSAFVQRKLLLKIFSPTTSAVMMKQFFKDLYFLLEHGADVNDFWIVHEYGFQANLFTHIVKVDLLQYILGGGFLGLSQNPPTNLLETHAFQFGKVLVDHGADVTSLKDMIGICDVPHKQFIKHLVEYSYVRKRASMCVPQIQVTKNGEEQPLKEDCVFEIQSFLLGTKQAKIEKDKRSAKANTLELKSFQKQEEHVGKVLFAILQRDEQRCKRRRSDEHEQQAKAQVGSAKGAGGGDEE